LANRIFNNRNDKLWITPRKSCFQNINQHEFCALRQRLFEKADKKLLQTSFRVDTFAGLVADIQIIGEVWYVSLHRNVGRKFNFTSQLRIRISTSAGIAALWTCKWSHGWCFPLCVCLR
jgi:hypothetical protein